MGATVLRHFERFGRVFSVLFRIFCSNSGLRTCPDFLRFWDWPGSFLNCSVPLHSRSIKSPQFCASPSFRNGTTGSASPG